ncbi:MAG: polymer-forming cytoskeletal protein [Candidatus Latescibacterota bacterium]|nr:polymer-forming cytoskeletal protein [Candidatus Latescibacterota bacterium]
MSDPGNFGTVIGQGSLLEGTLLIEVESDLVEVGTAEIHGTVVGTIRARHWVRIGATARLNGSIETPRLIVEEGAMIVNR